MERKTVPGIMLTLLVASMLTLAFNIQSVRASGTVYVRADGSVDPPTAPIPPQQPIDMVEYFEPHVSVMPGFPTTENEVNVEVSFFFATLPPYVIEFGPLVRTDNTFSIDVTIYVPAPWEHVYMVIHWDNDTCPLGRLSAGTYQFDVYVLYVHYMEGTYYLAKNLSFDVTMAGDIDRDGYVGSSDFSILAGAYGSSVGDSAYKPEADIDNDGYVGSSDFSILAGNYGQSI